MRLDRIKVALRTKGNHKQGMGDITGSIAIAEEFLRREIPASFVVDNDIEAVNALLKLDLPIYTIENNDENKGWDGLFFDLVIVNQLTTPDEKLDLIRKHCERLVTIDDIGDGSRRLADLRINPLYYDSCAICDPSYIPLNSVYQKAHSNKKTIKEKVKKALITMGGSDTYGLTPQIIEALMPHLNGIDVYTIIGPAFRHFDELEKIIDNTNIKLLKSVSPETMFKMIMKSDMAICGGGNTLFEMACCGTPVLVICNEPFEEETAYRFERMGFGMVVPFSERLQKEKFISLFKSFLDRENRKKQSITGRTLVDGKGVKRIVDACMNLLE